MVGFESISNIQTIVHVTCFLIDKIFFCKNTFWGLVVKIRICTLLVRGNFLLENKDLYFTS